MFIRSEFRSIINVFLFIYSLWVLLFEIKELFYRDNHIDYYIGMDLKSEFIILILHFVYLVASIFFLFKRYNINVYTLNFGIVGFLIMGMMDVFFNQTYGLEYYLFYFLSHISFFFIFNSKKDKKIAMILAYMFLWGILGYFAYVNGSRFVF